MPMFSDRKDRIVVPVRTQHRARKAVDLDVLDWADEISFQVVQQFSRAKKGDRAAMVEARAAAESLLAILAEYQRKHYP